MLQAQRYVAGGNWAPLVGHVVTAAESSVLATCLAADATTLTNAAAISIVDAIRGLQSQLFTWATIGTTESWKGGGYSFAGLSTELLELLEEYRIGGDAQPVPE